MKKIFFILSIVFISVSCSIKKSPDTIVKYSRVWYDDSGSIHNINIYESGGFIHMKDRVLHCSENFYEISDSTQLQHSFAQLSEMYRRLKDHNH